MVRFPVCSGTSVKTIIRADNIFLILVDFLVRPALPPILKLQIFDSAEMSPYYSLPFAPWPVVPDSHPISK